MRIIVYDVHASESGALSILNDLYNEVCDQEDKDIEWLFIVSTPEYKEKENIKVLRYPWVKKSWLHRMYFEVVVSRRIFKKYQPEKILSLQNKGVSHFKKTQYVYLHLAFVLTDYKFSLKKDEKKLWIYQNIMGGMIFKSLRKANKTIVQTQWMKDALVEKARIKENDIIVIPPNISISETGRFTDSVENRKKFFYPATAFNYKNHITILKACKIIQERGIMDYEVIFTIQSEDNKYTKKLSEFVKAHNLNVVFKGTMSREQVFESYKQMVLLFPSYIESFGLPLLEARINGGFVIAADLPFSREILRGYDNAMFFKCFDNKTLGDHMVQVITNQREYGEVGSVDVYNKVNSTVRISDIVIKTK